MADWVFARGIEFCGFHGCSAAEREVGQRFVVDLEIEADVAGAGQRDDLARTIDYGRAIQIVLEIGQGPSVHLVETLAERMAAALLDAFPPALSVRVTLAKQPPPVNAVVASAGVCIHRTRRVEG